MKKRLIALLLCVVMLATTMGAGILMPPDIKLISADTNEVISSVAVPQSERVKIATDYESSNEIGYQWQLSQDGKTWVNIYDQTGSSILLSYAMVCNMLSEDGTAQVRCIITDGDSEYESRTAEVSVDYSTPEQSAKAPARAAAVQNDAAPAAANDVGEGQNVYIVKYVFKDGSQAAPSWTATVPKSETGYEQTVTSPTVVGYEPDQDSVTVKATDQDTIYTVTYSPAVVSFTVNHYQQNIDNDEYTLAASETKPGYTDSAVGDGLRKTYEGFTALLYDTTIEIAADSSTVIDIYYDRNYYLLSLNLDGGYGAEPMYARYGTKISIDTPTKAGYTFTRWDPALPETMPAKSSTHTAKWEANDTAKVTVVIWGENANDENYSFYSDGTINLKPGTECTADNIGTLPICGKEEHTHSSACGSACTHTHDLTCYGISPSAKPVSNKYTQEITNRLDLVNCGAYKYRESKFAQRNEYYYLYWEGNFYQFDSRPSYIKEGNASDTKGNYVDYWQDSGAWPDSVFRYNSQITCTHTHNDACYTCGKAAHKHDSSCYLNLAMDSTLWTLNKTKTGTVTVEADGSTIFNVYYDRVKFKLDFQVEKSSGWSSSWSSGYSAQVKWGADTTEHWNKAPSGYLWYTEKDGSTFYTNAPAMPQSNLTIYGKNSGSGSSTVHYRETGTEKEIRDSITVAYSSWSFTDEDYIDIPGFTYDRASVNGSNYYVYYIRNSYELSFYNYNADVEGKTESVKYEAPLSGKYFAPEYPDGLEPGAYVFAGWYTTSGCYAGSEVDWSKDTMPANDLKLYAKWTPVTHTVRTYLTKDAMDSGSAPLNTWNDVQHRTVVENAPTKAPENGNYTFVGWFYMDNGTEKAFDFSMPVTKDLDLYAKWSSNSLVQYTIKYVLEDGTEIAPPTTGSALAGTTKTFFAKGGSELDEGYQSGYFPKTSSHSLTMDINGSNEYTFVYVSKPEVKYTVRYLEAGTNKILHEEKTATTNDAVITEKFETVSGYAPDAYQKKLVLSAEDSENIITFWYTKDEIHAPVQIIYWKQNIAGDGYTEYQSSTNLNGEIGKTYTADQLNLNGFQFNERSVSSGVLDENGLVLNMYYDRIEYPYEFRFLEQGTGKKLENPITGNERYQAQVTANAKNIPGYELVGSSAQAITIAIEDPAGTASKNVKIFYYEEKTVDIKYQIIGSADCGTLSKYTENSVNAVTGTPAGSTASITNDTYKFVGWYLDAECTQRVDSSWVSGTAITPQKTKNYGDGVMGYESATYYAKFEYNLTSMTLKKEATPYDANDMFIFTIKDSDGDVFAKVALKAGEEVTLTGLTVGETYTVSEDSNWSWRYADQTEQKILIEPNAGDNVVTVTNTVTNNKWLGASSYAINKCVNTVSAFFAKLFN